MRKSEIDRKKVEIRSKFNRTNQSGIRVEQMYGIYRTEPGRHSYEISLPSRLNERAYSTLIKDIKAAKRVIDKLKQLDIQYEKSMGRL